jgi:hypothetical protein
MGIINFKDKSVKKIIMRRLYRVEFDQPDDDHNGVYDPKIDHWFQFPSITERCFIVPEHELNYWRKLGNGFKKMEYIGTFPVRRRFDFDALAKPLKEKKAKEKAIKEGTYVDPEELKKAQEEATKNIPDYEDFGGGDLG